MGIRVHKVVGYGLTDVRVENDQIEDPRFSKSSVIAGDYEEREEFTNEGFLKFLEDKKLQDPTADTTWPVAHIKNMKNQVGFNHLFIHDAEFALGNVFCCIPLMTYDEWHRYDDAIDYFEETCLRVPRDSGLVNHFKLISEPLYPFIGYWDARDGRLIDNIWAIAYKQRQRTKMRGINVAAKHCGFKSSHSCNKYLKPEVPDCVRWQIEYANIFVDNSTIFELQPMIYTYWS